MNKDQFEKELKEKLDQFSVEVPDFPMKKSRSSRITNWFFNPASIPFPEFGYKKGAFLSISWLPVLILPLTFILFML
ncbi:hypothetical protein [Bacillus sinesaloumensis]|uniref:hypothetical protein n=1 Tax=Litchfieldia sinesaloumensis TaxID=1926280 RepID=UPI0009888791|nr:hypothetical protein [Bacillus sinesaloumensis]